MLILVESATLVAVISAGFSVQVPSAFWYSTSTSWPLSSVAVATPAAWEVPS